MMYYKAELDLKGKGRVKLGHKIIFMGINEFEMQTFYEKCAKNKDLILNFCLT